MVHLSNELRRDKMSTYHAEPRPKEEDKYLENIPENYKNEVPIKDEYIFIYIFQWAVYLVKCRKRKTMYEDKYRKRKIMWSWKLGKLKREKLTRENAREWPIKVLLNGKIKKTTYKEQCKQRRPKENFIKAKNQENNSQGKRQKKKASSRGGESPNIQSQHRTCLVRRSKYFWWEENMSGEEK